MIYRNLLRPMIFRNDAQTGHQQAMELLRGADQSKLAQLLIGGFSRAMPSIPVSTGGVDLDIPMILAAGFIKGDGFNSEAEALDAVKNDRNIIPGWRTMPNLVGPCEFGSFTPQPRMGNPGTVMWRDVATRSTQNRVGLKNPGVKAAAEFLSQHKFNKQTGINIASSPGVSDLAQEKEELLASLRTFVEKDVRPAWFTLNLSCPNTEDDPTGNQTEQKVLDLCGAAVEMLKKDQIPLWVKVGPDLSDEQYGKLMHAFAETGVKAVIATNTLGQPAPDGTIAGVGGGKLHAHAVRVAQLLVEAKHQHDYPVDVIGSGGVLDARTYQDFVDIGVSTVQYWSALIYQGPMAAKHILEGTS